MRCKLFKLCATQNILGSNYLLMINIYPFSPKNLQLAYNLQAKNVIGFPPLRHHPGVFELSVTMQLLHERKESTSNCFFFLNHPRLRICLRCARYTRNVFSTSIKPLAIMIYMYMYFKLWLIILHLFTCFH